MSGAINTQKLLVRLFFSTAILFLSVRIITGIMEAGPGGASQAGTVREDWVPGSQVVTLFLREYSVMPYVRVLVNGEVKGSFSGRYVTVAVHQGDRIEIDGTFYGRPVSIEILDVSGTLENPRPGEVINLNGNIVRLGEVKARSR